MQLLIADDHDLALDGLKIILGDIESDVNFLECGDFGQAIELAEQNEYLDLVVLDLNMPGMAGVSGVETFKSRFPDAPVLVMSGYYRRQDVVDALQVGAAGFLPKTLNRQALLSAFRLVLSGQKFFPADLLRNGGMVLDKPGDQAPRNARNSPFELLSGREREVVAQLLKGLTNKEIGRYLDIEEVTVKFHLSSIYKKIGAKNRAQAVKLAVDFGFQA